MKLKQDIIKSILRWFSAKILQKYKPKIIGITGSVGKSTAKEMIFNVLKGAKFSIRKSEKNYNNEIGIPLAIIGATGEKKNILQWIGVIFKAIYLILFSNKYPDILVLELAVDHPGDMKYFCDFISVDVGVLTSIGISHLENFGTKKNIFKEKKYLLEQAKDLRIYNKDGVKCSNENKIFEKSISYGFKKSDFKIEEVNYENTTNDILSHVSFTLIHDNKRIVGKLNNLIGRPYLYGVLAALSLTSYFNIMLEDALKSLENSKAIAGRMSLLKGIKHTKLIDDTYNSAPASVDEALTVIENIKKNRKVVILGDMLELGSEEEISHKVIGKRLASIDNLIFIAVGKKMKLAVDEYKNNQIENDNKNRDSSIDIFRIGDELNNASVYWFENSVEASKIVQDFVKSGDVILVKGSQGMRMERIVVKLMNKPNLREKLIVRQSKEWLSK